MSRLIQLVLDKRSYRDFAHGTATEFCIDQTARRERPRFVRQAITPANVCFHELTIFGWTDLMDTVAEETQAISNQRTVLSVAERREKLAHIASLLNEALKRGEEKFALAKSTYDTVCGI